MRFRAEVKDVQCLLGPLSAFDHVSHLCMFVFSSDRVRIVLTPEVAHTDGEQVFADIPVDSVFESCRVESLSNNQIPLLCHIPSILKILKGFEKSEKILMRLSKRDKRAYLSIESQSGGERVTQELPIQIQAASKLTSCEEPSLNDPTAKVNLPPLRILAQMIDKMKTISEILNIEATNAGNITFRVQQPQISLSAFFSGLQADLPPPTPQPAAALPSPAQPAQTLVERAIDMGISQQIMHNANANAPNAAAAAGGISSLDSALQADVGPPIPHSALQSAVDVSQYPDDGMAATHPPVESIADPPVSCSIAMKRFASVMNLKNMQMSQVVGCIIPDAAFVVYTRQKMRRGGIVWYLPLVATLNE